jgi:hypothetical protein
MDIGTIIMLTLCACFLLLPILFPISRDGGIRDAITQRDGKRFQFILSVVEASLERHRELGETFSDGYIESAADLDILYKLWSEAHDITFSETSDTSDKISVMERLRAGISAIEDRNGVSYDSAWQLVN